MKSRKFKISIALLIVYMGVIFLFSSLPGNMLNPEKEFGLDIGDSIKHFVEFSILGALMANAFWLFTKETAFRRVFVTFSGSFIFSSFYGVLDEVHQYFVPTRYCTVLDALVDAAGSITGTLLFLLVIQIAAAKNKRILEDFSTEENALNT